MHEHHRELLGELTKVGLRPRLSQTNGNHARIEWETGGKVHSIVTSSTPSDRRSTLNARARIRRQLRDQGFYKPTERGSLLDTNGYSDLDHRVPTLEDRVAQLELDVITLLDVIATKDEGGGFDAGWQAASEAVRKTLDHAAKPEEVTAPAPKVVQKSKPRSSLLFFIPCDKWSRASGIARQSGKTAQQVSTMLWQLKKRGLVEHDKVRHLYRKKVECLL
jgi:hypothetical protein